MTVDLERAKGGDERAFASLVEPFRRELQLHCYRLLGSVQDAEDLVQETLLAAWRGLDGFEERASLRSWLYRIATNRSLNAIRERGRRPATERDSIASMCSVLIMDYQLIGSRENPRTIRCGTRLAAPRSSS